MIDCYSHFAVLDVIRAKLEVEIKAGRVTDRRPDDAAKAMQSDYSYAVLGSVIDHLLAHDGPSDRELTILRDAHGVWMKMRAFVSDFRAVRAEFERITKNPAAASALNDFNKARAVLGDLILRHESIVAALQSFQWELRPLAHIPPHPQANDLRVDQWPWHDVVLSRRSAAFGAEVMKLARANGSPQALAFGVGVVTSYSGNVVGSPYLMHGVGGPRRSHPYRDRLASYTVGAWIRESLLPGTFFHDRARNVPIFGSPSHPALPPWLVRLVEEALTLTYGAKGPGALPKVNQAYQQFIEHWRLLHAFDPIPPAPPIDATLRSQIAGTLKPTDYQHPNGDIEHTETDTGGSPDVFDPGPGEPWFNQGKKDVLDWIKEICLDILFLPVFAWRVGSYYWKKGDKPKTTSEASLSLKQPLSTTDFGDLMSSKNSLIAIQEQYHLDSRLHQLSSDCLKLMKFVGLLYPEPMELPELDFAQFLVLPVPNTTYNWPARPEVNANLLLNLPSTPLEKPERRPSHFAAGEKPIAFLTAGLSTTACADVLGYDWLLEELLESPTSPIRINNVHQDADRGVDETCWEVSGGTSITSDPVSVTTLAYTDV
ncbi:MAG: hypothetical protein JWM59_1440 [Verrucomicrobiales bacterium]|nr:hypothetical protein [Verrucomicrobiales bacterium]